MFTLNCKGKLISLQKPVVMGIVNITADSFYKGYLDKEEKDVIAVVSKMITDGATIIDIGGQSTKPGAVRVSAEVELQRVSPVIEKIVDAFPEIILSIDTFYSEVAAAAVSAGACIVNDVSAGNIDPSMIATVAKLRVPYICMHMQGTPDMMQKNPQYDDVTKEVLEFFIKKINEFTIAGVKDIIIDPGFGFGKTTAQNFELLKNISAFKILGKPIMAGVSRKGMIYRTLGLTAEEALNGTTILNTLAVEHGANILRVHDVKEAVEVIKLLDIYA